MQVSKARLVQNGFTLIEVLVALVVTSLLLGLVMTGALSARKRIHDSIEEQEAVLLAGSLVRTRSAAPFDLQPAEGSSGSLHWQVR